MLIKSLFKIYSPLTKLNLKIAKYIKKNNSRTISGLIASLLISSVIISIRQLGSLQFLEILAYDFVVQVANKTYTDPRLLIVEITERDIKNQNRWPISDATFAQLIQQLQEYQPKLIGLDVYREISSPPGTEALQKQFQNDNIITIKYLDHGNQQMSTPANIPESRIGFNDLMLDADNVVRRNLIYAEVGEQKFYSFSLRLSLAYLKDHPLLKNKETQNTPDLQATPEGLYIHNVLIKRLQANSGGYQMPPQEAVGFQTLINYQSPEIAQKVTLTDVLSGKIDPNLVKDKIVLIGNTAPNIKDLVDTPYSSNEKTQAGIIIHAQMVSQILSLVLDNDTQFWFWSETIESLWIVIWAATGAAIAWQLRHPLAIGGASILSLGVLWEIGLVLFLNAGWIPLIPPTLSFILTVSAIVTYKVSYAMFYDALTDLPNRHKFSEEINKLKKKRDKSRKKTSITVFCLDIDRFKLINRGLGYKVGDRLLQDTATSLQSYFASATLIARVGGDEFAIAVLDLPDVQAAIVIADRMQEDLTLPFLLQGRQAKTTIKVGVAFIDNLRDFQGASIFHAAQTAMYKAKAEGKTHSEVFTNTMHQEALNHLQLEADLYEAIENKEFELYYQPIISLKTGSLAGFEALVRWNSRHRGFVSPGVFIPMAEETSAIIPLGEWIFKQACEQMYQWQQEFSNCTSLFISVNLSVRQFEQKNLIETIQGILDTTSLPPHNLKLEITESMVMDDVESAIAILEKLKLLGIRLSMDDFGTGFSSFSYLHRFPMDTLKVDRSFVSNLSKSTKNKEIVSSIVMLAHKLGMDVIAEGIETVEEKEMLQMFNCEYGQGYLFSKPIPAKAIGQLLQELSQH